MVGVWDTVGAVGIPFLHVSGISTSTFGFFHTGLRQSIKHGFHALAIDEHRKKFSPTIWTIRTLPEATPKTRPIDSVEQRWFVGAHANVGGGCYDDLLAQIPLRWMMRKASLCGLTFRNELEPDNDENKGTISDSYKEFLKGWYSTFVDRSYRPIGAAPKVTSTDTQTNVNETIDSSVFERWRSVPNYRPDNLVDWATRHKVDIATLGKSVRADDPSVVAPD